MKPLPKMKRKGDGPDKTASVLPHPAQPKVPPLEAPDTMDSDRVPVSRNRGRILIAASAAVLVAAGGYVYDKIVSKAVDGTIFDAA